MLKACINMWLNYLINSHEFILTTENRRQVMDVDKQLRVKSQKSMHVEVILINVNVMTQVCLTLDV